MKLKQTIKNLFKSQFELNAEEAANKKLRYLSTPNYINKKLSKSFFTDLISMLIEDFYENSNRLHQQFKLELEEAINKQSVFFANMIDSEIDYQSAKAFTNSFVQISETKYCRSLVNFKFIFCWYQIIKKLNIDIIETKNSSIISRVNTLYSDIGTQSKKVQDLLKLSESK